jgi:hypothetical protein
MNTVEKTSTGVTPAEFILSHSIRLSSHIMTPLKMITLLLPVLLLLLLLLLLFLLLLLLPQLLLLL